MIILNLHFLYIIKTNKKAVKNVIKTIKEDKNLKSQFSFYNVLKEQYTGKHADTVGSKAVLEQLAKIVCENIDPKTVKASNRKLREVMIENGVKPSEFVDEESMKLYENGNVILTTKRVSENTIPLIESYDAVCKWMDAHKDDKRVRNLKCHLYKRLQTGVAHLLNRGRKSYSISSRMNASTRLTKC